jgi:hypothetical protein
MTTFDTPEPIVAIIDTGAGNVLIRAADRADTAVDVRPANPHEDRDVRAAEQTQVEYAHGTLQVTAPRSARRWWFGRPPAIDVTVDLPSGSSLDATVVGEVRSEGRLGETTINTAAGTVNLDETARLKVKTAAGNVTANRATGHVEVTTAAGKVRIGDIDGTAEIKTSNGDITVGGMTGEATMKTANGDISVDQALAGVEAKTAFGSLRVGEVVQGMVRLETSFGQVELGVRDGTAAWLDVGSGCGSVRSDLDAADRPQATDDSVEVRAHTGYGNITIRRVEVAS